jgi:hypothetical protein
VDSVAIAWGGGSGVRVGAGGGALVGTDGVAMVGGARVATGGDANGEGVFTAPPNAPTKPMITPISAMAPMAAEVAIASERRRPAALLVARPTRPAATAATSARHV